MKFLWLAILIILLSACSTLDSVQRHHYGTYEIFITNDSRVNVEYQEICLLEACGDYVNGFVNYKDREIWASDNATLAKVIKNMADTDGDFPN